MTATAELVRELTCAHCRLPVVDVTDHHGHDALLFCCSGCQTAWSILHDHGLGGYYTLPERRELAVTSSSRSFEEFDHPTFHELHVRGLTGGAQRVVLVVEGIHCASCVWLVERVPLLVPGVIRAELNVRRSEVALEWDPAATRLSAIAQTLASLGYPPHPGSGGAREDVRRKEERASLVRIGIAGAIAINVMLAALAMYTGWFGPGLDSQYEHFFRWLSLGLVIPAIAGPGRVFFRGAWAAIRTRALHLDLPIAVALGAGFVRGAINTVDGNGPVYLDGIAILIFLLLVGRYLQQRWQRAATDASELLHSLTPHGCRVVEGDEVREVPAKALTPGMLLDVRAGDTLAADGVIERGQTTLNTAWLTGESLPVSANVGDTVLAGTLNVSAPVQVRVTNAGEQTRVARVLQQVEESALHRAPVVLLANRIAGWFVVVVLTLAVITWALWVPRDPSAAMDHAIALLIVTCPCALAMATPLSVTVALGRAARLGILVKGGDSLQVLAGRGTIMLDKTGTITTGESALAEWQGPEWVKPLVLAVEAGSLHPVAEGFRRAWPDVSPAVGVETEHVQGGGIVAHVGERQVVVGSPRFVTTFLDQAPARHESVGTPVWVAVDGTLTATAAFGDPVRHDAATSVQALESRGWRVEMLSGDAAPVCRSVAQTIGIPVERTHAESTPESKRLAVEEKLRSGPVVMVGDGVNDAAAMATASVGIAVHGGAEAALVSSDAYLTTAGLAPVVTMIDGARRTMRVVKRNIAFSLAYNLLGIALAMTGHLDPVVAAIMMPLSSLTVVAGAWYGRTFRREPA